MGSTDTDIFATGMIQCDLRHTQSCFQTMVESTFIAIFAKQKQLDETF